MSRYKTPPPVRLLKSITGFFERAQQQGQIHGDVNPRFIAQLVFSVLMGRGYLSDTMPQKISSKDNAEFIKSTTDLVCHGIVKDNDG